MSSGIRMSGMVSGIDTEAIVQAMVATHVAKKEKLQKSQTKLQWKQDAYKAINTKVNNLYNKISNLRFSGAYNMKKTTVSDPTKATITASGNAVNGTQKLQIEKLATSGYLTGAELKKGTTGDTTLGDLGYAGGDTTITVTTASGRKDIALNESTKISDLVSELNKSGVKASFDEGNGRFFISAAETGKKNDFSLTGLDMAGLNALNAVGLSVVSEANTETYETMAKYAQGTEAETKTYMLEMLNDLKAAYVSNAEMAIQEKRINERIAYSDAKDAVTAFDTDEDSALLIKLLKEDSNKYKRVKEDGEVVYDYENTSGLKTLDQRIRELARDKNLIVDVEKDGEMTEDTSKLTELRNNVKTVIAIDDNDALTEADKAQYYLTPDERQAEKEKISGFATKRAENDAVIANKDNAYWDVKDYTDVDLDALAEKYTKQIMTAKSIEDNPDAIPISDGATRVNAEDAKIILNNAEFTSDSNVFNINGLTIKATGETKEGETITINTDTDTQGLYDKVKDFLSEYNSIINELSSLYNADSSKGYEPLTDEQKAEMSESEIEKWETKIKDSLLRRDSTIGGVMNAMTNAMMKSYNVNGKTYSLASFGIHTMGYLNAAKNENYAYHIDGDAEDSITSGNKDKLMDMITNNPEDLQEFMKQLTSGLYTELDNKMKSTKLSSRFSIYNDKQMTRDNDNYTKQIKNWENKIADLEDRYYKQYSNMEKQLAKMQSSTSSLSSLFGNQ